MHRFLNCFNKLISQHRLAEIRVLLLFCLISFASCTPKAFKNLNSAGAAFSREQTELFRSGLKESLVYKTVINYKDKEFSSLTYFNVLNDSVFKIILLTSFGNTLLEAEVSRTTFKVNNVISYLNRKPILRLLENDWRLMLAGNFNIALPAVYSEDELMTVFNYTAGRTNNLYHYSKIDNSIVLIESFKGKSRKIIVAVVSTKDAQPEIFSIEHPSLKLKISMSLLKKVSNDTVE